MRRDHQALDTKSLASNQHVINNYNAGLNGGATGIGGKAVHFDQEDPEQAGQWTCGGTQKAVLWIGQTTETRSQVDLHMTQVAVTTGGLSGNTFLVSEMTRDSHCHLNSPYPKLAYE